MAVVHKVEECQAVDVDILKVVEVSNQKVAEIAEKVEVVKAEGDIWNPKSKARISRKR